MKILNRSLSNASLALLAIQLGLVSVVAARYLYQRWTCPRVWTRAVADDPALPLRGRYLSLQLMVDGCQSTLPSAKLAAFPRDYNGAIKPGPFTIRPVPAVQFRANLKVEHNRLLALYVEDLGQRAAGQWVSAWPGESCAEMHLDEPVNFYIPEQARSPLPLQAGQELWIEVTAPPQGAPHPTQLAVKQDGVWRTLRF